MNINEILEIARAHLLQQPLHYFSASYASGIPWLYVFTRTHIPGYGPRICVPPYTRLGICVPPQQGFLFPVVCVPHLRALIVASYPGARGAGRRRREKRAPGIYCTRMR